MWRMEWQRNVQSRVHTTKNFEWFSHVTRDGHRCVLSLQNWPGLLIGSGWEQALIRIFFVGGAETNVSCTGVMDHCIEPMDRPSYIDAGTNLKSPTRSKSRGRLGRGRPGSWVLHIEKVRSIPSPYFGNVEEQKSWRRPFSFFQNSFIFHFCFGPKVSTDFPEFSKILCSFVTKRTIICFRKSWCL